MRLKSLLLILKRLSTWLSLSTFEPGNWGRMRGKSYKTTKWVKERRSHFLLRAKEHHHENEQRRQWEGATKWESRFLSFLSLSTSVSSFFLPFGWLIPLPRFKLKFSSRQEKDNETRVFFLSQAVCITSSEKRRERERNKRIVQCIKWQNNQRI